MDYRSEALQSLIPDRLRIALRAAHRRYVFSKAMEQIIKAPVKTLISQDSTLDNLIYGWGNEAWSAQAEYLKACIDHVINARGTILECGSGLTTLVIGAVAKQAGKRVWSLEHSPEWAERVRKNLVKYGLTNVTLSVSALKNYGHFDWYNPPLDKIPHDVGLVICDGPPGSTKGGRYGLLPVMLKSLSPTCVVLLDDAGRKEEVAVANQWCEEFNMKFDTCGEEKPYIVMTRAMTTSN